MSLFEPILPYLIYFFFNDPSSTDIYTLSLHDALPISLHECRDLAQPRVNDGRHGERAAHRLDRKSTRLNSSHTVISYAVFCLKKKKRSPCSARKRIAWSPIRRLNTGRWPVRPADILFA